ncbi:MAG: phosphoglycerate kinase [Candidatus Spechtbacteria bacterium]|nr:phosphoglycerate kinase [Candidatus Spechtbacteria bacterium]
MKTLRDAAIENKTVLLRADFNVTVSRGAVTEDFRMRAALPTIQYVLTHGAKKVLVISHFGRPAEGKPNSAFSLAPVGRHLSSLLNKEIDFVDDCIGENVRSRIKESKKRVIVLENLRFYKGEEENDTQFAKSLAALGDIFVQDAFGAAHRAHASIVGVPKFLPSYAGFLFEKEVRWLSSVLKNPVRPLAALIGGAKISTKMPVIEKFLKFADNVCLGGALANTVLKAKGVAVGKSLVEEEMVEKMKNFEYTDARLHLPVDIKVAKDKDAADGISIKGVGNVGDEELILDIGPDTQDLFSNIVHRSKTIIWNGPMGYLENKRFAEGTRRIAKELGNVPPHVCTIVGGGDTYLTLADVGVMDRISFVSTGGGAMLDFLAKGTLPGIEALG